MRHREDARDLLHARGLRATGPRVAVLEVLRKSDRPISHSEVVGLLADAGYDQATIYRNLVKLRDAGVATVASRLDGIDRYAMSTPQGDTHQHPHFLCEDCGRVACLPEELAASLRVEGPWAESVRRAVVQLTGECPDCLA